MYSAQRAGENAGAICYQQRPDLSEEEVKRTAVREVIHRRDSGIAHTEPVAEFVEAFCASYAQHPEGVQPDGVQQASALAAIEQDLQLMASVQEEARARLVARYGEAFVQQLEAGYQ